MRDVVNSIVRSISHIVLYYYIFSLIHKLYRNTIFFRQFELLFYLVQITKSTSHKPINNHYVCAGKFCKKKNAGEPTATMEKYSIIKEAVQIIKNTPNRVLAKFNIKLTSPETLKHRTKKKTVNEYLTFLNFKIQW